MKVLRAFTKFGFTFGICKTTVSTKLNWSSFYATIASLLQGIWKTPGTSLNYDDAYKRRLLVVPITLMRLRYATAAKLVL